jgi:hypothetical protein
MTPSNTMSMTPTGYTTPNSTLNWTSSYIPDSKSANQNEIEATVNGEIIPDFLLDQGVNDYQAPNQNEIEATVNGEIIPDFLLDQGANDYQAPNYNKIEATVNGEIIPDNLLYQETNNSSSNLNNVFASTPSPITNSECERYLSDLFPPGPIEKNTQIDAKHLQCFNGPDNTFTFSNGRVIKEINQSAFSTTPVAESFQLIGTENPANANKNNYFSFESKSSDDSAPFIELGEYSFGAYSNFQSITGKNINGPPSLEPNKINKLPPAVSGRKAQIAFSDDSIQFDYKSYNNSDGNSSEYKSSHSIPEQNKMIGRLNLPIPNLPQNLSFYG